MRFRKTRASWAGMLAGLMLALPVLAACGSEPSSPPPAATQASDTPMAEATLPPTIDLAVTPDIPAPGPTVPSAAPPAPTAAPASPPVTDASAAREELQEAAFRYLRELAEGLGPRESSTAEEKAAADFLAATFTELGYSPSLQEFEETSLEASLTVDAPVGWGEDAPRARPLTGSSPGNISGFVEFVGLAREEDIPEEGLDGKIALIERGEISFGSKVDRVRDAGAEAAIVFNNQPGGFQGTLGRRGAIPAVAISQANGVRIKELMAEDRVEVTLTVEETAEPSQNLIAELPGTGEGVVVVGAHYDTTPGSIGASDNASGMGVLLALAEELAGRSFPFTLRFIAFGAEETGLNGSDHYVDSLSNDELSRIYAMINIDAIGSGRTVSVSGDRWLTSYVSDYASGTGVSVEVSRRVGGGSDHANFRNAAVPVLFFIGDDLSRINSPRDTMEHINAELLGDTAAVVLALLLSVDQLPGYGH